MREDYDAFVRAGGTRLLRVALLMTGDRGAAEDLVQEVLERMYVRWPSIDDPHAYARAAMGRHVADRWRRLSRRPREVAMQPWHDRAADDGADARAERSAIVGHLAALPPRQRAVIVLRYFEDWSEERIADELDVSRGTVKSQASKGLDRLRRALGGESTDGRRAPASVLSTHEAEEAKQR
ncbi:SigE family RNA polymerase sigma factor [Kineococcus rubinsiae]|uniref:SigE family RNA polymerase sigma factor n=1 Tax=Kineococcus rubinsiae TaxID=2609562 RepID=UPI00142F8E51|nr:SigE family RNA polymerase sigma factor [Kineococcus rubinsiae]NIZ91187.1 SigE family RNA polymerase sigma factor [Kineococcus rubinsiae]